MRSVDLVGIQMELTTGAPVLLLREHDAPHRVLPIFVGGAEAASIALAASGQALARPLTHDLMAALVEALDGHLDAVEVTELHQGTFLAHLSLRGPGGRHQIDTRPSDAIALAVRLGAPLFVSDDVLDEAGTVLPDDTDDHTDDDTDTREPLAPEQIDAEVDRFRRFLGELDPADFLAAGRADALDTDVVDTDALDTDAVEPPGAGRDTGDAESGHADPADGTSDSDPDATP